MPVSRHRLILTKVKLKIQLNTQNEVSLGLDFVINLIYQNPWSVKLK